MNITVSCRNTCPFPRHLMDRTGQAPASTEQLKWNILVWHIEWMTRDTNFTLVFPSQSPLRLFSSHSSSSVFYLHPSPHALASGAKFRWNKWKEFRQMHRWEKQLLTAWGLFFREVGVVVRRQSLLVDSDRSGRMGLYVSLSFSQRLSLQEPLDLLSCKCATWAALRRIPCICLTVTLFPEICLNL